MNCPRCGHLLPADGTACPICAAFAAGQASALKRPAAKPTRHGRNLAIIALTLLCIIGAGAIVVRAGGGVLQRQAKPVVNTPILRASQSGTSFATTVAMGTPSQSQTLASGTSDSQAPSLFSAQGTAPPAAPILSQSGQGSHPTLSAPTPDSGMPDDIRKWLEHLERTEQQRNALASSQLMQTVSSMASLQAEDLTGMMGDDDGDDSQAAANKKMNARADKYVGSTDAMRRAWSDLIAQFHSMAPPAECAPIRSNYDQVLGQTGTMMLEIIGAVKSAAANRQGALQSLMAMQGQSTDRIDRPAKEADGGVQQVCSHYSTKKWFDIKSDVGGDLMSKLGF